MGFEAIGKALMGGAAGLGDKIGGVGGQLGELISGSPKQTFEGNKVNLDQLNQAGSTSDSLMGMIDRGVDSFSQNPMMNLIQSMTQSGPQNQQPLMNAPQSLAMPPAQNSPPLMNAPQSMGMPPEQYASPFADSGQSSMMSPATNAPQQSLMSPVENSPQQSLMSQAEDQVAGEAPKKKMRNPMEELQKLIATQQAMAQSIQNPPPPSPVRMPKSMYKNVAGMNSGPFQTSTRSSM